MLSQYPHKTQTDQSERLLSRSLEARLRGSMVRAYGIGLLVVVTAIWASLITWSAADPSLTHVTRQPPANVLGYPGAVISDLLLESLGLTAVIALLAPMLWGAELALAGRIRDLRVKLTFYPLSIFLLGSAVASLPVPEIWPLSQGLGGILGDAIYGLCHLILATLVSTTIAPLSGVALFASGCAALAYSLGFELKDVARAVQSLISALSPAPAAAGLGATDAPLYDRREPIFSDPPSSAFEPAFDLGSRAADGAERPTNGAQPPEAQRPPNTLQTSQDDEADKPTLLRSLETGKPSGVEPDNDPDLPPSLRPRSADGHKEGSSREHFVPTPHPAATDRIPDDLFDSDAEDDSAAIARRFAPANGKGRGYAAYADPPKVGSDWAPEKSVSSDASAMHRDDLIIVGTEIESAAASPAVATSTRTNPVGAPKTAARKLMQTLQPRPNEANPDITRAQARSVPAPWEAAVPTVAPSPITSGDDTVQAETTRKRRLDALGYKPSSRAGYKRPSTHLLEPVPASRPGPEFTQAVLRGHARMLLDVLSDFGIKGEVREIKQGPVVTLYELEPQRGTKSSRVVALADDIARAMSVSTARIAAQPGRSTISIELPNVRRETVSLRGILEADAYRRCDGILPLALGKSVDGSLVVPDLARIPHLLIGGAPGSGKTMLLHAIVQSLIYRHGPETCRLLLIDQNMIELSNYNDIPHLLAPVITDPAKALAALNWVVAETEERHKRMSKLAVRNIEIFNNRVNNARKRGEMIARTVNTGFDPATGEPIYEYEQMDLKPMPYIVVVLDEFAELMRHAAADVEAAVRRIAATAQAAGIHLIMATQNLSPDVVTERLAGTLRTRMCFKTGTKADSRTLLDSPGAEQLLDYGDLLLSSGTGAFARIHAAHIGLPEIESVVEFLRAAGPPDYAPDLVELVTAIEARSNEDEPSDDRYVAGVVGPRKASRPRLFAQLRNT